jgi:hypothetical protein
MAREQKAGDKGVQAMEMVIPLTFTQTRTEFSHIHSNTQVTPQTAKQLSAPNAPLRNGHSYHSYHCYHYYGL